MACRKIESLKTTGKIKYGAFPVPLWVMCIIISYRSREKNPTNIIVPIRMNEAVTWHSRDILKSIINLRNSINPFAANAPFLYVLKTSEIPTVFWWFQGVEKGCIGNKWVNETLHECKFFFQRLQYDLITGKLC